MISFRKGLTLIFLIEPRMLITALLKLKFEVLGFVAFISTEQNDTVQHRSKLLNICMSFVDVIVAS
jgi:hypothetical protein